MYTLYNFTNKTVTFDLCRAQRIHLEKLNSIANRSNKPTLRGKSSQAALQSIDGQERFFRNKQRIHQYK